MSPDQKIIIGSAPHFKIAPETGPVHGLKPSRRQNGISQNGRTHIVNLMAHHHGKLLQIGGDATTGRGLVVAKVEG